MTTVGSVIDILETIAPPALQESYDNAGLITGQPSTNCTGILCCLDATEAVLNEALEKNCNMVIAHHPIVFSGLKKINGKNYVERVIIKAIKNDIAIYAIHTNLDNIITGVNKEIADRLGLINQQILAPKENQLEKLFFFVPEEDAEKVKQALFDVGGGLIGNYSECSFSTTGTGTFLPNENANPHTGKKGQRHEASEQKVEILYPTYLRHKILSTLRANHPYEEVAYEVISINNHHQEIGSGVVGELPEPMALTDFLELTKRAFHLKTLKHTALLNKEVRKVSVCGGAGAFLIKNAINSKSDIYISSDIKYHEFFDADGQIVIIDMGHYESEQFTVDLLQRRLQQKILNFAVLKTTVNTNPVHYL